MQPSKPAGPGSSRYRQSSMPSIRKCAGVQHVEAVYFMMELCVRPGILAHFARDRSIEMVSSKPGQTQKEIVT